MRKKRKAKTKSRKIGETAIIQTPSGPKEVALIPDDLIPGPLPKLDPNDPLLLVEYVATTVVNCQVLLRSTIKRKKDGSYVILDQQSFDVAVQSGTDAGRLLQRALKDARETRDLSAKILQMLDSASDALGKRKRKK
jgi:hypothetical protein